MMLVRDDGALLVINRATIDGKDHVGTCGIVCERNVLRVVRVTFSSELEVGDSAYETGGDVCNTLVIITDCLGEIGQIGVHQDVALLLDPGEDGVHPGGVVAGHVLLLVGEHDARPPVGMLTGNNKLDGILGRLVPPHGLVYTIWHLAIIWVLPSILAQIGALDIGAGT